MYGPIKPISLGGNRYFLTFTDDFSGKTWVYLIKEKGEVFQKFKDIKSLVEKQSGYDIKEVRSNCGEYIPNDFEKFCKENEIVHQY